MKEKLIGLGVILKREQTKKIIGGNVELIVCQSSCTTHDDCASDRGCYSRVCDEDKTKNYKACFRF